MDDKVTLWYDGSFINLTSATRVNNSWKPFEVERSDGSKFRVGDAVEADLLKFTITGFAVSSYGIMVSGSNLHSITYLKEISKQSNLRHVTIEYYEAPIEDINSIVTSNGRLIVYFYIPSGIRQITCDKVDFDYEHGIVKLSDNK